MLSCSVLLVQDSGVPRENQWPFTSHWKMLSVVLPLVVNGNPSCVYDKKKKVTTRSKKS